MRVRKAVTFATEMLKCINMSLVDGYIVTSKSIMIISSAYTLIQ